MNESTKAPLKKGKASLVIRLIRIGAVALLVVSLLYALLAFLTHGDPTFTGTYYVSWLRGLSAGGGCYSDTVAMGSTEAVKTAIEEGSYNVKLDVILKDGVLMTDYETSYPLSEALALTGDGACGVILQVNGGGEQAAETLCALLSELDYQGNLAVQSTDTQVLAWLRDNRPNVVRGLVTGHLEGEDMSGFDKFLHRNMMKNYTCRPHYVVYDASSLPTVAAKAIRKEIPLLAGDVADITCITELSDRVDGYILEDFDFSK